MKKPGSNTSFTTRITASETAVRVVLADLRLWLAGKGIATDTCNTVELVMAEALNNIVEHACPGDARARVDIEITRHPRHLNFVLRDAGRPMPELKVPKAQLPDTDRPLPDLPEGGFGWYLIHQLTDRLSYVRRGNQNLLSFGIETTAPDAA